MRRQQMHDIGDAARVLFDIGAEAHQRLRSDQRLHLQRAAADEELVGQRSQSRYTGRFVRWIAFGEKNP